CWVTSGTRKVAGGAWLGGTETTDDCYCRFSPGVCFLWWPARVEPGRSSGSMALKLTGSFSERLLSAGCALLLLSALASAQTGKKSPATGKKPAAKSATTAHTASRKSKKSRRTVANWRRRGQQKI